MHAIPTNADLKMARALDLFNGSAHPRTVAGVARSLGAPIVAVRPSPTEGSVVTIASGWELSWYRFEVDLADEAAGLRSPTRAPSSTSSTPARACRTRRRTTAASCTSSPSTLRFAPAPEAMIYCVVPEELADELYDRLVEYYRDDPNVKVIVDRRKSERRARGEEARRARSASSATAAAPRPRRVPAARHATE